MPNPELLKYVTDARVQNLSNETIKSQLLSQGWSEQNIQEALSPDKKTLNLPIPPAPHFGMWVAFLYIVLFISLYISATSLGGILHEAVNKNITDKLDQTNYGYGNYFDNFFVKFYIAGIIVSYPIFAMLFLILKRQALKNPAVKNLRARKLLIYFTLVATFIIMVSHIIYTVVEFLGGSTTLRSVANLGVNLAIAGSIFTYLLLEIREDRKLG